MKRNTAVALTLSVVIALVLGAAIARFTHRGWHIPFLASSGGGITTLHPPRALTAFTLYDTHDRAFGLPQLRGHWSFVYFGYTHCDDTCPATLTTFKRLHHLVGGKAQDIQYVFVSVDPKRDTAPVLARYLNQFHPGFVGITGDNQALDTLARQMGVYYRPNRHDGASYEVGHSDEIYLVDPEARLSAVFSAPARARTLARGLRALRSNG